MDKNTEISEKSRENYYIPILIILVAFSAFGLGRLSTFESNSKQPIVFEPQMQYSNTYQAVSDEDLTTETFQNNTSGSLVASKNGAKYHFPWCSGAQRMKESNKVWFDSKEEAEKAGYTPASNCKGL